MNIAVLGAGMVGRVIAEDLVKHFAVTSIDRSAVALAATAARNPKIKTREFDLQTEKDYTQLLQPFDLVVTAVPGFMGFETVKRVIEAGKNVVDISFSPEDILQLDGLAKENNVTAIVDFGVAPGMSNLVLGRYNEEVEVHNFECYVGGLPKERKKPFEYKAPFSPIDVIEEYTRPARLQEKGEVVTKPALTEVELMEFEEVGPLEAFNTDGLRSLLFTMGHIPNMKEKTLRYPGHVKLIADLKAGGFFDKEPIDVEGTAVSPLAFSSALLLRQWQLLPEDEEFTVMKIIVEGEKEGLQKKITYDLLDRYDVVSKTSSMARSTGYTCTAAVHLLLNQYFDQKGVFPPEHVGKQSACFDFVINYLRERGVNWKKTSS